MTIISLVLIILVHYLFIFFKTTLTIPKIKDLVNRPQQKYEDLFNAIRTNAPEKKDNLFCVPPVIK